MSHAWQATKVATLSGATFALLEGASAFLYPVPLDPSPTHFAVVISVVATGMALGIVAFMLAHFVSPRHAAGLTLALWAAVWGPHEAEVAGWHRVGWAPPIVIGGLAIVAPPLAVGLGTLGGVSGSIFRRRGGRVGLAPLSRATLEKGQSPDILLVTVDAVRSDARLLNVGQWRRDSDFSPVQGWTHFTQAVASGPWVLPSMHSLFSGQPVRVHGGGLPTEGGTSRRLSDSIPFPYVLQQVGYSTAAVVSSPFLSVEQGFADGFDSWSHSADSVEPILLLHQWNRLVSALTDEPREIDRTRNARMTAEVIRLMAKSSARPRFIWVHLVPPRGYLEGNRLDKAAYEESIQSARTLIRKMARNGDGWVVAVAGTHGEAFGEDGSWGDGDDLSEPLLRVPLAIRRPNTQGGVVSRAVSTADLPKSLLATAAMGQHFPGRNLMSVRRKPIEVGGVRHNSGLFAARNVNGKYLVSEPGETGPGVKASDRTEENLRRSGYLD